MRTLCLIMATLCLLAPLPRPAQADDAAAQYQPFSVQLPSGAWNLKLTMLPKDAAAEPRTLELTSLDGYAANACDRRTRGMVLDSGFGSADYFEYFIWAVPEDGMEQWQAQGWQSGFPDIMRSGPDPLDPNKEWFGPPEDPALGRARFEMLLAESTEITVDGLHIYIYAPLARRVDIGVERIEYTHVLSGTFTAEENVIDARKVPFELSHRETRRHLTDIVMFPHSHDLGFLTAGGEQPWPEKVEGAGQ